MQNFKTPGAAIEPDVVSVDSPEFSHLKTYTQMIACVVYHDSVEFHTCRLLSTLDLVLKTFVILVSYSTHKLLLI